MDTNHNYRITIKIVNIVIALISLLLLLYTGFRAASLSFTFDESLSFNRFVSLPFMDIVSYKVVSSNNHMINTLFMKYISIFFGATEFLLRMPSLLSHLIYIIFSYKIIGKVSSPFLMLAGFLLLNLNPFLLDYFSLARGYAMAVSFTMLSIYYLFAYIENSKTNCLYWSLFFAMFAVLCNFCLVIFYISLLCILNLYWISLPGDFKFKDLIKKNIPLIISFLSMVLIMFEPIRKLTKFDELYDGGKTGFWTDTVGSLINSSLYGRFYKEVVTDLIKYIILLSVLLMVITLIYRFFLKKVKVFSERTSIALLLLLVPCVVSVAQHYIINSLYLINRMALFFIPLFFIPAIYFISDFFVTHKLRLILFPVLFVISGALLYHTITSVNMSHTLMWRYDADTKGMLSDLESLVKNDEKILVSLGEVWLFEPTSNFYRKTKNYDWLEEVTWEGYKNQSFDYYYLADSCMSFITSNNFSIIKHYPVSNTFLIKNN